MTDTPAHRLLSDLRRLLDRLRGAGFGVGLAELEAARRLILTLEGQGGLPDPERLQGMLGAILCRNREQQQAFPRHFADWLGEPTALYDPPPPGPTRAQEGPQPPPDEPERPKPCCSRPFLALLAPLLFALGLLLACRTGLVPCAGFQPSPAPWIERPIEQPVERTETPPQPKPIEPPKPATPAPIAPDLPKPAAPPEPAWTDPLRRIAPFLLLPLLLWWLIQRLARGYLRRRLAEAPPDLRRLTLSAATAQLYQGAAWSGLAQLLRRHEAVDTDRLDLTATVEQSVRHLGWFTPVTAKAQQRPEYLALVERAALDDQQTRLIDAFLDRLEAEHLSLDRWYYEGDPRWCYPYRSARGAQSLDELAGRYPGRRLLLLGPGHGLLDPLSGHPAPWLDRLHTWPQRVLFTLEPPGQWRYLQELLGREGLLVAPLDTHGLRTFLEYLHRGLWHPRPLDGGHYPPLLVRDPDRYLERHAPARAETARLLAELRGYLGGPGLAWLAACAVYPELHWQLTLHLGERLGWLGTPKAALLDSRPAAAAVSDLASGERPDRTADERLDLTGDERLARLTTLPWLRHNYLPDWLRAALIAHMPHADRRRVRRLLRELVPAPEGLELEIGQGEATASGPPADHVFVEFLVGGLTVPIPDALRGLGLRPRRAHLGVLGLLLAALPLPAGEWRIEAAAAGFLLDNRAIAVQARANLQLADWALLPEPSAIPVTLTPEPPPPSEPPTTPPVPEPTPVTPAPPTEVHLTVRPDPAEARVRVMDITPKYRDAIPLAPGPHEIEVSHPGFRTFRQSIAVTQDLELPVKLEPLGRFKLTLTTVPPGAQVRLLDSNTPYTPGMMITEGSYRVEATLAGYQPQQAQVELTQDTTLEIRLTPEVLVAAPSETLPRVAEPAGGSATSTQLGLTLDMVPIPAGCFLMGSPDSEPERDSDEGPQHKVCVPAFEIGRHEVTFDEWDACVAAGGCTRKLIDIWGRGRHPAMRVNWGDIQQFLAWINRTGGGYRLPSEAEWEYAYRAGTTTPFYTGNCVVMSQANYDSKYSDYAGCGAKTGTYLDKTQPVGSYPANPWGLYDMAGNVSEWVDDCGHADYQGAPQDGSSWKELCQPSHLLRGGYYSSIPKHVRAAYRGRAMPDETYSGSGFRLARSP